MIAEPRAPEIVRVDGPQGLGPITVADVAIKDLGQCKFPSPVAAHLGDTAMHYVGEADKILVRDSVFHLKQHEKREAALPAFELAGPRKSRVLRSGPAALRNRHLRSRSCDPDARAQVTARAR